jgi:tetratricopeptide (TPR) repeat protein
MAGAGRLEDAVAEYQRALELRPGYALAHNNLAIAFLRLGRAAEALENFRSAIRFDPSLVEAHLNAGLISRATGQAAEAAAHLRQAVQLGPDWILAVDSLASLLAAGADSSVRNPEEAIRLAEHAVALTNRHDANALDVAAVAYGSAGKFDLAIAAVEEALALNPPPAMTTILQQHLALFQQGRPFVSQR